MSDPVVVYDRQASELAELYDSLAFQDCHRDVLDLVPERPGLVLDVGAGSGRDAGWFAVSGWESWRSNPPMVCDAKAGDGIRRRRSIGSATVCLASKRCTA